MTREQFEALVLEVIPSAHKFYYAPEVKDLCYFTFDGVLNSNQLKELKTTTFTMMAVNSKIEIAIFSELLTK